MQSKDVKQDSLDMQREYNIQDTLDTQSKDVKQDSLDMQSKGVLNRRFKQDSLDMQSKGVLNKTACTSEEKPLHKPPGHAK